jgi:hypothetical protein
LYATVAASERALAARGLSMVATVADSKADYGAFVRVLIGGLLAGRPVEEIAAEAGIDVDMALRLSKSPMVQALTSKTRVR